MNSLNSYTHIQDFQRVMYETIGMSLFEFQRIEWEKRTGKTHSSG